MNFSWLNDLLAQHQQLLVFINVLLQQLGLPVPAVPTMMFQASQVTHWLSLPMLLLAAVCASLLADLIWYQAGKQFGYRILKFLCRMSINPGSCVNQTEQRFARWGIWSVVFGKFIPGFSTMAPPVAGALGMSRSQFLLASAIGAALWAGLALAAGYALQAQIAVLLALLAIHGIRIVLVFAAILASWIGWKFWQKKRFERMAAIPHIQASDLQALLQQGQQAQIIDLRSPTLVAETGVVPGALQAELSHLTDLSEQLSRDTLTVTFCACPGDASAIHAAHRLQELGFTQVRPLRGGFDAWQQETQAK